MRPGIMGAWGKGARVIGSLEAVKNRRLAELFDAARRLGDGWCGGLGLVPDKGRLNAVAERLVEAWPDDLRPPAVTPTLDGNLVLEWPTALGAGPWVNIDLGSMEAEFCGTGEDRATVRFDLGRDDGLAAFVGFLRGRLPSGPPAPDGAPSPYAAAAARLADIEAGRGTLVPLEDLMREYGLAD
jgi:hypothetical protein